MQAILLSWMMLLGTYGGSTNYAADMFETTSHDFGVVVKGSKTEFDFVFTNKYKEDVEIMSVTSSCQCTTPSFSPRGVIKSWEKGKVHISINTKSFVGNKNATITVRFSKPYYTEVQLHSYVFIRTDVAVEPGVVYFGTVTSGSHPALAVNINSVKGVDWTINDVQSTCGFLSVELKQTARSYGLVSYQMVVHLKDNAPPGSFSEYLELITNDPDPRSSRFLVPVEGRIRQPLSASPSPLSFGLMEAGKVAEKSLVLQASEPFTIRDITSEDRQISASIDRVPKKVQVVKLMYRANEPRTVNGVITLITDVEDTPQIQVVFNGKIVPAPEPEVSDTLEETEAKDKEPEKPAVEETKETLPETETVEIDESEPAEPAKEKPVAEEKPVGQEEEPEPEPATEDSKESEENTLDMLDLNEPEPESNEPEPESTEEIEPVDTPATEESVEQPAEAAEEESEEKATENAEPAENAEEAAEETTEEPIRETATLEKPTKKIGRNLLKK